MHHLIPVRYYPKYIVVTLQNSCFFLHSIDFSIYAMHCHFCNMIDYDISYNRHNVSQLLLTYFLQIHTIQLRMMLLYKNITDFFVCVFFLPVVLCSQHSRRCSSKKKFPKTFDHKFFIWRPWRTQIHQEKNKSSSPF